MLMERNHESPAIEKLLSCQEAADRLGISVETLYVYKCKGKLKAEERKGMRPAFSPAYIAYILEHGYEC